MSSFFVEMSSLVNEGCDEKVILDFCAQINKRAGLFHLEQRVLWLCLSKVKALVFKARWGTGVDVLKLAGQKGNLKDFILKVFSSQKYSNYDIEVGNLSVMRDVAKVSPLFYYFAL
jgi:hypothetical protein